MIKSSYPMSNDLTSDDITLILESLKQSKRNIREGSAPDKIKREALLEITAVEDKLIAIRERKYLFETTIFEFSEEKENSEKVELEIADQTNNRLKSDGDDLLEL